MFKVKCFIGDDYDGEWETLDVYNVQTDGNKIKFLVYHNRHWKLIDANECVPI